MTASVHSAPAVDLRARVAEVRGRFRARFDREPDGVWAAPGRVNLMGEHTDYNDGFALPFALDRTTLAAVAGRGYGVANCYSEDYGGSPPTHLSTVSPVKRPAGWSAYPLGVAWALTQLGVELSGFDLYVNSDVPDAAGVSSSAALEGSVALALADLTGSTVDRAGLALACRRAENEIAGAPTGVMDQMAAMLAHDGSALFLDCRSLAVRQIPFDPAAQHLTVLVVNTKVKHALVHSLYGERRQDCMEAARVLGVSALRDATLADLDSARAALGDVRYRRARHVTADDGRVLETVRLLEAGRIGEVGPVLSAAHASLRDDFEVSCVELDTVVEAAVANGALGSRMIGGGFGGSAIVLVSDSLVGPVSAGVRDAARSRGFPDPQIFPARPAPGARRVG